MTLALKIQYDGTNYSGWQIQNNAQTIQGELTEAIYKITNVKYNIIGAGRTDAGVHARNQVATIQLNEKFPITEQKIKDAINSTLPNSIRIKDARIYDIDFNARFDAIYREYSYNIILEEDVFDDRFSTYIRYDLDLDLLWDCARIFRTIADFTTFSKASDENINPICYVSHSYFRQISPKKITYRIRSNHFLYGMVRALVGAMLDVARGKRTINEIELSLLKRDRKYISPLAPAKGLILENICYPEKINF